jgi:hypothetical protein
VDEKHALLQLKLFADQIRNEAGLGGISYHFDQVKKIIAVFSTCPSAINIYYTGAEKIVEGTYLSGINTYKRSIECDCFVCQDVMYLSP